MQCSGGIVGIVAPSQVETIKGSNPPLCITSFYDFLLYLTAGPLSQLSDMFLQLVHYSTPLGTRAVRESQKTTNPLIIHMQVATNEKREDRVVLALRAVGVMDP